MNSIRDNVYALSSAQKTVMLNLKPVNTYAKRATNLSLSGDVLDAARELGLNLSKLCDTYLRETVRHEQIRRWRQEYADFIAAYNAMLETEGLPLDEWRNF